MVNAPNGRRRAIVAARLERMRAAARPACVSRPWDGSEGVWVASPKDRGAVSLHAAAPRSRFRSFTALPPRARSRTCSGKVWRWSRRPPPISTARDGKSRATFPARPPLAYSTESMRLTTRLMQVASWLLLQRAVNEGELTSAPGPGGARPGQAFPRGLWLRARAVRPVATHPAQLEPALAAHSGACDASRSGPGHRRIRGRRSERRSRSHCGSSAFAPLFRNRITSKWPSHAGQRDCLGAQIELPPDCRRRTSLGGAVSGSTAADARAVDGINGYVCRPVKL